MKSAGTLTSGLLGFALAALICFMSAPAFQAQVPEDSATILVSHLERPIGRETYEMHSDGQDFVFTDELNLVERGGPLRVTSSLRLGPDFTPSRFRAKGKTYRFVNVDADVEITNGAARIQNLGETARVSLPKTFFTALGYAPLAGRALLIRYWEHHNRPAHLSVVPGMPTRDVTIELRGVDTVRILDRDVRLRRYTVDGVVWGRESVWLDDRDHFAAILTRIHILPLEGIREDLKQALPALQRIAVADQMQDLARIAQQVPSVADGTFALVGATVIDGTGRPPIEKAVVLVRDGRISAVGPGVIVAVPSGIRVIDMSGKTVTPGLWDMHSHASQIEWASAYLGAGVTSIRDMGGEQQFLTAFRDALAKERGTGPRMFLAGLVDGEAPEAYGAVVAANPEDGRTVVDRYHAAGFQQMKLYTLLQPDVVNAIISRAHALGMSVTGHIPTSLGVKRAVEAGMDHVAHMPVGGDPRSPEVREVVELLARRHTVVDPTLPWNELLGRAPTTPIDSFEPGIARAPQPLAFSYRSVTNDVDAATAMERLGRQQAIVKALHDAGVPIVAGTDGALPGYSLLRSLELYVQAGFSPMEALQTATLIPAKAMRVDAELGTIEVGKRADLLVLDANPLVDISNIRKSRWVIANGRMYESAALWRAAEFSPPR